MQKSKIETKIALKKAKSSIEKIMKMIDEDKYCIDIMNQILAVQGLLRSSSEKLLVEHLNTCFVDGIKEGNIENESELITELMSVMRLSQKAR